MAVQFIVNLLVAVVWATLMEEVTLVNLIIGFLIGMVLLYVFRSSLGYDCYTIRLWQAAKLLVLFMKEVIVANIVVVRQVLAPKLNIKPGIIALPLDVKTDVQITILASMITLTPGTLSMDVSEDRQFLYVHVFNIDDKDEIIRTIKGTFEKGILEVAEGC
jgi:multicomponent Na+:H+ antiporter subunit E